MVADKMEDLYVAAKVDFSGWARVDQLDELFKLLFDAMERESNIPKNEEK